MKVIQNPLTKETTTEEWIYIYIYIVEFERERERWRERERERERTQNHYTNKENDQGTVIFTCKWYVDRSTQIESKKAVISKSTLTEI